MHHEQIHTIVISFTFVVQAIVAVQNRQSELFFPQDHSELQTINFRAGICVCLPGEVMSIPG